MRIISKRFLWGSLRILPYHVYGVATQYSYNRTTVVSRYLCRIYVHGQPATLARHGLHADRPGHGDNTNNQNK